MSELIVLDPSEVAENRTEYDISSLVRETGLDWGDAAIEAVMAQGERGTVPVDFTYPNREIKIPLRILELGSDDFDETRTKLQAKVSRFQEEGGWLKRQRRGVAAVYADIVNASLLIPDSWQAAQHGIEPDAVLTLMTIFDFYEVEEEITAVPFTGSGYAHTVLADLRGDMPARVRVEVTETDSQQARGLLASFRSRHYASASTAAVHYEAETMTPFSPASVVTLSGASGAGTNNTIRYTNLPPTWVPVMNTNLVSGDTYLTHEGSYRCWARVYTTSEGPPQVRLVYDVGDSVSPTENAPVQISDDDAFYLLDLGTVRLERDSAGTHRWQGQVQAKGPRGGEDVYIDELYFFEQTEWYGAYSSPRVNVDLVSVAYDNFEASGGAATGVAAPSGGTWRAGAAGGSTAENGDSDDFAMEGGPLFELQRGVPAPDSSPTNGRYLVLDGSSTISEVKVQSNLYLAAHASSGDENRGGLLARFVDTDNWLMLVLSHYVAPTGGWVWSKPEAKENGYWVYVESGTPQTFLDIYKRKAGTVTNLGEVFLGAEHSTDWYALKLSVDSSGEVAAYYARGSQADTGEIGADPILTVTDADFATGGTLEDGRVGVYHAAEYATGSIQMGLDDFLASAPASGQILDDGVLFPDMRAELRTDAAVREAPDGGSYGGIGLPLGRLPRLPAPGLETRSVELSLRRSRGDLALLPDGGLDDLSVRVFAKRAWLYGPDE